MSAAESLRADIVEVGRRLYARGFIAGNESRERAWERMEVLEQYARITLVARAPGGERAIGREGVAALEARRVPAGDPPPPASSRTGRRADP